MSFDKQISEIRALCENLFEQDRVDLIFAYADGDLDDGALIPFIARSKDDVEQIKWGDRCWQNLAPYLHGREERLAIVAKACDARAVVQYINESQLERNKVYIIGVDCPGMFGPDGDPRPGCIDCKIRVAPVCDTRIEDDRVINQKVQEPKEETKGDGSSVSPVGSLKTKGDGSSVSPVGSLARFREEIDKCILCYSCRQACYGCYCNTCFIQRDMPDWQPSEIDAGTKMTFHLGRVMHLAGRCVECGACESACASGVNVRYIIKEATNFVEEMYDFKTGMDTDTTQAMLTYKFEDKEVGFFGGDEHE